MTGASARRAWAWSHHAWSLARSAWSAVQRRAWASSPWRRSTSSCAWRVRFDRLVEDLGDDREPPLQALGLSLERQAAAVGPLVEPLEPLEVDDRREDLEPVRLLGADELLGL